MAVLSLAASHRAVWAQKSELQCENQYCRATGTVGMETQTYPYTVPNDADYDLIITLTSRLGDVDL